MSTNLSAAPFTGFPPAALRFFRELSRHQDKVWYTAHKAEYEQTVRDPLASLVADVSARLAAAGSPLRGDPKRSVFRLHRDVRFSPDKSPYKTHASVAITRDGDKLSPGVLYFHLDPAGSFAAAGFFRPEAPVLHRLRVGLLENSHAWLAMEKGLAKHGLTLLSDDKLLRLPRGFEAAPGTVADSLKLKSWVVKRDLAASVVGNAGLVTHLLDLATAAAPLLNFGWTTLDERR